MPVLILDINKLTSKYIYSLIGASLDLYISTHGNEKSSHGGPSTRSKLIADQINRGNEALRIVFSFQKYSMLRTNKFCGWILNSCHMRQL